MSANPKAAVGYDAERVWRDFPILRREVHGKPLVFLDSAASSQRPTARDRGRRALRDAASRQRASRRAPAEPGSHRHVRACARARARLRQRRLDARGDLHARHHRIHQSRGAVVRAPAPASPATRSCSPRSNITPTSCPGSWWPEQTGAVVKAVPMDRRGVVERRRTWPPHINERTRIVACAHVSNALGTVLPVREITRLAHARGAVVLRRRRAGRAAPARRPRRRSIAISTPSPRTRCTAPPASACSSAASRCSRPCRRGRAAAT